jgi:predicted O-linked N-acetylglucosamine transferase (SPINDLY family)
MLRAGTGHAGDDRLRETLIREGVDLDRLLLAGKTSSRSDYMALFQQIDISLDPFPYNGVTTTCDSLWMGVPVVSLAGHFGPSRQGVRMLQSVGLKELVASTPDDYIRIALDLANNARRISELRNGLRAMMLCSPLMDPGALAHHFEATCRGLGKRSSSGFELDVTQDSN